LNPTADAIALPQSANCEFVVAADSFDRKPAHSSLTRELSQSSFSKVALLRPRFFDSYRTNVRANNAVMYPITMGTI
jgi:hypothetical protein